MRYPKEIEIEADLSLSVTVNAQVIPGRPAPCCQNPDSPAFSDSGDPPEIITWNASVNGYDITDLITDSQEQEIHESIILHMENNPDG